MKQTWWIIRDPSGHVEDGVLEQDKDLAWDYFLRSEADLDARAWVEQRPHYKNKGYTATPIEIEVEEK